MRIILILIFVLFSSSSYAGANYQASMLAKCTVSLDYMTRYVNVSSTVMRVSDVDQSAITQWHLGSLVNISNLQKEFNEMLTQLSNTDLSVKDTIEQSKKEQDDKLHKMFLDSADPLKAKSAVESIMINVKLCKLALRTTSKI